MDIRQFMKRISISDSRSVENITDKISKLGFNQHSLMGQKVQSVLWTSINLHRQKPEKDKQISTLTPLEKILWTPMLPTDIVRD